MAKLIWSPQAIADLSGICEYIARDSQHYARVVGERIFSVAESITAHPLQGAMVPEYLQEDLRERLCQNYRIVYRLRSDAIEIVTICHGARLLPPMG
jgi:plasmid stabilization system protein ParE